MYSIICSNLIIIIISHFTHHVMLQYCILCKLHDCCIDFTEKYQNGIHKVRIIQFNMYHNSIKL